MNKFEKAIAEIMLAVSALATGAEVVEKDVEKLLDAVNKVRAIEQSAPQGSLTPAQVRQLKKQHDELLHVLSDPALHKKLTFAEKEQVDKVKSESYKIFRIDKPVHFPPKK